MPMSASVTSPIATRPLRLERYGSSFINCFQPDTGLAGLAAVKGCAIALICWSQNWETLKLFLQRDRFRERTGFPLPEERPCRPNRTHNIGIPVRGRHARKGRSNSVPHTIEQLCPADRLS